MYIWRFGIDFNDKTVNDTGSYWKRAFLNFERIFLKKLNNGKHFKAVSIHYTFKQNFVEIVKGP